MEIYTETLVDNSQNSRGSPGGSYPRITVRLLVMILMILVSRALSKSKDPHWTIIMYESLEVPIQTKIHTKIQTSLL